MNQLPETGRIMPWLRLFAFARSCLLYTSELAESSVVIGARAWVKNEDYWNARWRILEEKMCIRDSAYTVKSGSSMATPVVSGAVALLMEKYPRITNVEAVSYTHLDVYKRQGQDLEKMNLTTQYLPRLLMY